MARLTKKARRAAALKGWRNRTRQNPNKRQRKKAAKADTERSKRAAAILASIRKGNPPNGWIPATAVKITRKNGRMVVRIRKAVRRKAVNPRRKTANPRRKARTAKRRR